MDYKVITKSNTQMYTATDELEKTVKMYLSMGWKLQGGVNMFIYENCRLYVVSQAIYK